MTRTAARIVPLAALPLLLAVALPCPAAAQSPAPFPEVGGSALLWRSPEGLVPLPSLSLEVEIEVTGMMVRGIVVQSFRNPTDEVIETLFAFPLPGRAAVHHMEMRIGERRVTAVIRERGVARRTYERAREEGRKGALVEQSRPNLFTSTAANINPGERVEIRLEYVQELPYEDGEFRLAFPLTFTPRSGPGGDASLEAGVPNPPPAAAVVAATPTARVVARVRPGFPLEGGDIESPSHPVETRWDGDVLVVEPAGGLTAADRDFRLRWRPQLGLEPRSALFAEERDDGRYLLLMVLPPRAGGLPTETLFVVDTSGSMAGRSIAGARQALRAALDRLRPEDTFALLEFDDRVTAFHDGFLPARPDRLAAALAWVDGLRSGGGTRIDRALERALALIGDGDPDRASRIIFLTDGAVSSEEQVLGSVRAHLRGVRLHALGIGAAPNRYLMRRMASHGRGLCEFIADAGEAAGSIDAFFRRLDRPVLTDVWLDVIAEGTVELSPDPLPDLHAGEALFASLRLSPGARFDAATLGGRTGNGPVEQRIDVPRAAPAASGLATRWGRARVRELMDRLHEGADPAAIREQVIGLSRAFRILTRYTGLVAVETFPTAAGPAAQVTVPSPAPASALPAGGTSGPLWTRAGAVLSLLGGALLLRALQVPRRPPPAPRSRERAERRPPRG